MILYLGFYKNILNFKKFKNLTELKFEKAKFKPAELNIERESFRLIRGHDHLHRNLMDILETSFIQRIFAKDPELKLFSSGRFEAPPNACPTYSDIYFTAKKGVILLAEVKTDNQLQPVSSISLHSK